jgi:hypothetical protein
MDKATLRSRLEQVSIVNRAFAARFISDELPNSFRYFARLNQSFDGNPLRPGEHVFPDDVSRYGDCVGALTGQEAVDLLCREMLVPEWIDISVVKADNEHTYFELLCCGRFTAEDSYLYYPESGFAPFGSKSPLLPPGWSEGQALFELSSRPKQG